MKKRILLVAALASAFFISACDRTEDQVGLPRNDCLVQFFASENFGFDTPNLFIVGPGEFSTLGNLPNAQMNWSGKVKSMRVGQFTTLRTWSEENFQGNTTIYLTADTGNSIPNVDGFRSMQITCER